MHDALEQHDAISRRLVTEHHGTVVKTTGDGIHAVFADPQDALRLAVALQLALADPAATGGIALRVRCGLHAGTDNRRDNDFYGNAVNRAARVMSAAHGGQILVSGAVATLVRASLPEGVSLRDLGAVRLRDLAHPEEVSQVVHPQLRQEFPALRSLASTPHNLPQPLTSFIGREHELAETRRQLSQTRLLTLVGIGGLGKSRLSLETAASVLDEYPDGVWFVELAPVTDPRLVPQVVASALGVKEEAGRPVGEALLKFVVDRRLLLVLDNCEHLTQACAELARGLLEAGPHVRILASSRERLNIRGEKTFPLAPLAAPLPRQNMAAEALETFAAARLFVDRVCSAQPDFVVTTENATAVAEICHRLDGIPLALELAAARARAMPIDAIASRLSDRFKLLRGGDRTALPRQQTLRALIDWSYELLSDDERMLFARLSVFAGGFTLEAAEAVAVDASLAREDIAERLAELVEKSLVSLDSGVGRYRMLETVRQYAEENLNAAGEGGALRTRHLKYYVALAESARPELTGPAQGAWLARLDREFENILAAHYSCQAVPDNAALGLQLVSSLKVYWIMRGHAGLGLRFTVEALGLGADVSDLERCRGLFQAGQLAMYVGRYDESANYLRDSLAIARANRMDAAVQAVLPPLATTAIRQGNLVAAREHLRESVALARELGNTRQLAVALNELAQLDRLEGEIVSAKAIYTEVLELARNLDDRESIAIGLLNLSMVAMALGTPSHSRSMLREALTIATGIGSKQTMQTLLDLVAALATSTCGWHQAARLHGAAEALAEETGLHRHPADEAFMLPYVGLIRGHLADAQLRTDHAQGRTMGLETAIEEARACLGDDEAAACTALDARNPR